MARPGENLLPMSPNPTCIGVELDPDGMVILPTPGAGEPCIDCPRFAETGQCSIRLGGESLARLASSLLEREEIDVAVLRTLKDGIPYCYSRGGIGMIIQNDPPFAEQLARQPSMFVALDLRGVHNLASNYGDATATDLIHVAVARARSTVLQALEPMGIESSDAIIAFRDYPKADEIGFIIMGADADQGAELLATLQRRFSAAQAIADDRAGRVPVLATFAGAPSERVQDLMDDVDDVEVGMAVLAESSATALMNQSAQKGGQYDDMWNEICAAYDARGENPPTRPDNRDIVEHFRQTCLPNFSADPAGKLRQARHAYQ